MPLRRLVDLTEIYTSLRFFELQPKTRNVLPLLWICRKSFAVTCHITLIFVQHRIVATLEGHSNIESKLALVNWKPLTQSIYRGTSSEKIIQCNISSRLSRQERMSQRFQPENLLRSAKYYHMIVVEKLELERHRSVA